MYDDNPPPAKPFHPTKPELTEEEIQPVPQVPLEQEHQLANPQQVAQTQDPSISIKRVTPPPELITREEETRPIDPEAAAQQESHDDATAREESKP